MQYFLCHKAWKYLPVDGAEEPEQGLGPVHGEDDQFEGVVGSLLQPGQLGQVVPGQEIL